MEKVTLQGNNLVPNFIGAWTIDPLSICDELISHFELNPSKQKRGKVTSRVSQDQKNSTDMTISPKEINMEGNEIFKRYFDSLFSCYQDYIIQWPFLKTFAGNLHVSNFNIQRYQCGQHFQHTHTERSSLSTLHRVFAWMTYLNDVEITQGGSTYFNHYDLEVQPKKGLTLIWPSEWTHAHKGNVLDAGSKYIITGWMHFPD